MSDLSPTPRHVFTDASGVRLANGKLYTYAAGTVTPLPTYTDETEGVQSPNPIILDSHGEATIWVGESAYRLILKTSADVLVWDIDNVIHIADGEITTRKIKNGAFTSAKIATNAAITQKFEELSATTEKFADASAVPAKIPDGSIGIVKLNPDIDWTTKVAAVEVVQPRVLDFSSEQVLNFIPQIPWSAPSKLSNPGTLPASTGSSVSWSPSGEFLAVGHTSSPRVTIYQRMGTTFVKLTNPGTLPTGNVSDLAFSPNGEFLAVAHATAPRLTIYQRSGSTFTKLTDPTTLPTGVGTGVSWSPNGKYLAVAGTLTNVLYRRDGTTFTPLIDSVAGFASGRLAWAPDGILLAGCQPDGSVTIVTRTDDSLAVLTSLDPDPTVGAFDVAWSPDGNFLAVAINTSPYIAGYVRTGDVFVRLADPASLPAGSAFGLSWSTNGFLLAIAHSTSPYLTVYRRADEVFTKLADVGTPPAADGADVAWSPTGEFLAVAHSTSPFVTIYQTASVFSKNALLYQKEAING